MIEYAIATLTGGLYQTTFGVEISILLAVIRLWVGVFFALSGLHKLFSRERHASLVATLEADGIPSPALVAWPVATTEYVGGVMIAMGAGTVVFCVALIGLCIVACVVDGTKRVKEMKPLDFLDRIDDWLYLSETGYILLLVTVLVFGPGEFSLDALLFAG